MVQRKASTLQPLKTETLFQQQEIMKNSNSNGADLKKKIMKKSGSFKRPKQPRKPPPIGKTPNYMKPTSSSDARKEQSLPPVSLRRKSSDNGGKKATNKTLLATKNHPSFKPARKCSPVVLCEDLDAQRATCSSTLKDCKFPAYLSLNPGGTESEGTSAIKVCPYTYCSLNGHHRAPLPPLKCFLSARRRMIKTQRSFKLGCLSPRRAKPVVDDEKNYFFIEICINKDEDDQEQQVSETLSDAPVYDDFDDALMMDGGNTYLLEGVEIEPEVQFEDSDMDWEKGYQSSLPLDFDFDYDYHYECTPATDTEPDPEAAEDDDLVNTSDKKDCSFDPVKVSQELYEESLISDAFSSSDDDGESTDCYHHMENLNSGSTSGQFEPSHDEEEHILSETSFDNQSHQSIPNDDDATESNLENSDEDFITESTVVSGKDEGDHRQDELEHEMDETVLARVTAKFKKSVEEGDGLGSFNPRGPNFLPLEVEPDGEKVDLRHQDLGERKNSEEWMVDYALRQVVTKLGPARNRRVSLLVEAFEKVMPIKKCDDVHLRHTSAFDQSRPLQTCI